MLYDFFLGLYLFSCGAIFTGCYQYLASIEPFCFYLPGGLGQYYKVHKNITTKFNDIIGSESIKEELQGHLKFFQEKKLTKGFLFYGPSGTGKTMMARAIAGESDLPFIEIFTSDLMNAHIPTVINAVMKKHSPCIIFIDECSNIIGKFNDTLLRKIDGITSIENVIMILATNKELDPAIHRSGRIDKVINFQLPTYNDRKDMFLKMGQNKEGASELAQRTANFSYADISVIPRETEFVKLAYQLKDGHETTTRVIDRLKFGRNTSQFELGQDLRIRLAYHEIGHLILAYLLKDVEKPHKITLVPEGKIGGHVAFNVSDVLSKTRKDILKSIAVLLASSIFETHYLGEYSTLCEDDFKKIEDLINVLNKNQMLGYNFLYSCPKDRQKEVKDIIDNLNKFIKEIIEQHNAIIQKFHDKLLLSETLNEKEIKELLGEDLLNNVDL